MEIEKKRELQLVRKYLITFGYMHYVALPQVFVRDRGNSRLEATSRMKAGDELCRK
jgi:hypothetical protein